MIPKSRDYSIFNRFNFERKPVGVKFLPTKPEGIERINKRLSFCEMFKEAQTSKPFYVQKEDFHCIEPLILGMEDPDPMLHSGLIGEVDGFFEEARANRKIYQYLPKMLKGSVNYVVFSPIDQLTFDPDVLVITAKVSQAQTLLRSIGYSTGDMWTSKGTPVVACSWIYIYPVLSGEMNFYITGLGLGMQSLGIFPEGLFLISVPWNLLPTLIENLQEMSWGPTGPPEGGDAHRQRVRKIREELRQRIQK